MLYCLHLYLGWGYKRVFLSLSQEALLFGTCRHYFDILSHTGALTSFSICPPFYFFSFHFLINLPNKLMHSFPHSCTILNITFFIHTYIPIWLIIDIGTNKLLLLNLNYLVSCPSLCDGTLNESAVTH